MENLTKEPIQAEIYGIEVDDTFKDYRNDIYFARKLAEVNQMIANGEMPDFV